MTTRRGLRRPRYPMPAAVEAALREAGLIDAYRARPDYQQNDYIWWITSGKRPQTRAKRLAQMLSELAGGTKYMNMAYSPRSTVAGRAKEG